MNQIICFFYFTVFKSFLKVCQKTSAEIEFKILINLISITQLIIFVQMNLILKKLASYIYSTYVILNLFNLLRTKKTHRACGAPRWPTAWRSAASWTWTWEWQSQYSTVQYSIEYSVVQSTLQYSAVQYLRMAESISASLVTRAGWTQALYTVLEPRVEEDTRYSTSRILPSE